MKIVTYLIAFVAAILMMNASNAGPADLSVSAIKLVDKERVGRTDFKYTYEVEVTNRAEALPVVISTVTSRFPQTQVIDGKLLFTDIPAVGTSTSRDTFTIQQDRRFRLNANTFSFDFSVDYSLEDLLLPPKPDPCDQSSTICESALVDPYILVSTIDGASISTVVSEGNAEIFSLEWTPVGNFVGLTVTFPGHPPLDQIQIETVLPGLGRANAVAAAMVSLATPIEGGGLNLFNSPAAQAGNHWGCDGVPKGTSCGQDGGCCDIHDVCIDRSCRGQNNSGNVIICSAKEALYLGCIASGQLSTVCAALRCSSDCMKCHRDVVRCFLLDLPPRTPSQCWETVDFFGNTDCGKLQQCIINDAIITDPCVCAAANYKSVDLCTDGSGGNGSSSGDPHLVTFDRLAYDFQGVGEFVLVRSIDDNLEIQTRMAPWGASRFVSINSTVAMNVAGDKVGVYLGRTPPLYVNGVPSTLTGEVVQLPNGGQIEPTQRGFTIVWPDSSLVDVTSMGSYLNLRIRLDALRQERVEGLLGNFDVTRVNELVTREGVILNTPPSYNELYKQYGNSWRITQEESVFDYINNNTTDTHTDLTFPGGFISSVVLSDSARLDAELICTGAGVTNPVLLENCILDVGLTGDSSFAEFPASVVPPEDSITIDALLGHTIDNPAKSCLDIQQFGVVNGDKKYWIKLPSGIFEMHCNFSADAGGWTRVGALDTSTGYCGNNALVDLRVDPDASMGKIPDSDAQALMSGTPDSPMELMYLSRSDGRYVWHALENVTDFDTSSKHNSSSFYCSNWHCDDGSLDASACGTEGQGCPVTAHGIGGFTKKIYVDSNFSRHIRGMHVNGSMCGLPNYERASTWIYVR